MKLRIGTRKSKLALAQTEMFVGALREVFSDSLETEIVPIATHGDKTLDKPLSQIGGKGVFVTEIEAALLGGEIDAAVHSAKDLPLALADTAEIAAVLKRGNHRDTLVSLKGNVMHSDDFFSVGTGSMRRMRNLSRTFPLAQFGGLRGNVDTRLSKLESGEFDAVVLASAGIERLGEDMSGFEVREFESTQFLPAPCQGIIAIEAVEGSEAAALLKRIDDENTRFCFETERYVTKLLNADCTMPVGAFSQISGGEIMLEISSDSIEFVSGSARIEERFKLAERLVEML